MIVEALDLTNDEILELIIEYKKTKSEDTLLKIIQSQVKGISKLINHYSSAYNSVSFLKDAEMIGIEAIIESINSYNSKKGTTFFTYCYRIAKYRISSAFLNNSSITTLSRASITNKFILNKDGINFNSTHEEILEYKKTLKGNKSMSVDRIKSLIMCSLVQESIDDNDDKFKLMPTYTNYDKLIDDELMEFTKFKMVELLSDIEFKIILLSVLEGLKGKELYKHFTFSKQRIDQIKHRAINKIKENEELCQAIKGYR